VELKAGEQLVIDKNDSLLVKQPVTDKLYNYYRTKEFICDDTPLWKLIDVVNEAYNVQIVFGDKALRELRIVSPFYNESLEQVLDVISLTFNLKVVKRDGKIILEKQ
jgi:transmembrane sensor